MIFRQAKKEEKKLLLMQGYNQWPKNRSFEQYCIDNAKEDTCGIRYVVEESGEIVSSLAMLQLGIISGRTAYGIASVLTPQVHTGKGYASELIKKCITTKSDRNTPIFLYSEISPAFYERFGFRVLPQKLQKRVNSPLMVLCGDDVWTQLMECTREDMPDYF